MQIASTVIIKIQNPVTGIILSSMLYVAIIHCRVRPYRGMGHGTHSLDLFHHQPGTWRYGLMMCMPGFEVKYNTYM